MSKNTRNLSARQQGDKALFAELSKTAQQGGSLSAEQLHVLARERRISIATLLGTSSFYDFLNTFKHGKQGYVCNGTSCLMAGKRNAAEQSLLRHCSRQEIGEATCLGHCFHGGAYWFGEQTFDIKSDPQNISEPPRIPFYNAAQQSLFTDSISDLASFYQDSLLDPDIILKKLADSRLRGRGGAGFHFADKLAACAAAPAGQKVIVCNADEGDPGAFSDRYLLEVQPQRVLAGMLAAAHSVGAESAYLYIRAEYPYALQCMREAITAFEQTPAYATSGVQFYIIRGAGAYICGEETALLNSIEGLRPEVRTRPPYPTQYGLYGQPTVLSNVETFAAVPWILQHGGMAFASIGTTQSTGTKLLSLDHSFKRPGVHEVELGVPLQQVINEYGGGFHSAVKAIQIGGPLGCVVPLNNVTDLSLDFESFAQQGFQLGHAGMIGIPQDFPMIDFLRHLFSFMAHESCGKCVPCRLGTRKGSDLLMAATKDTPIDRETFDDLLDALEFGSLCGLGGGLPLPVRNILQYFNAELTDYFRQGTGR